MWQVTLLYPATDPVEGVQPLPGASVIAAGTGPRAYPGASTPFIQGVAFGMPLAGCGSFPVAADVSKPEGPGALVDAGVWKAEVLRGIVDAGVWKAEVLRGIVDAGVRVGVLMAGVWMSRLLGLRCV